LILLWLSWFS